MTMKKKNLVTRVARWALLLDEFNYQIEHRSGQKMKHVDSLSRNPVMLTVNSEFLKWTENETRGFTIKKSSDAHSKLGILATA
ncbi:hypothetical protein QE152_g30720 [Popillia japonica]|uniref:Uncharacterized protein n=1 Tax=Popillia japonica TaxID=7064 RepID=A0AAW1JD59_POPJA